MSTTDALSDLRELVAQQAADALGLSVSTRIPAQPRGGVGWVRAAPEALITRNTDVATSGSFAVHLSLVVVAPSVDNDRAQQWLDSMSLTAVMNKDLKVDEVLPPGRLDTDSALWAVEIKLLPRSLRRT